MLDLINVNSVTIALPSILRDVHYAQNQLQWVMSAYALTYAAFLLVGGRLGDLFGHRRIFLLGSVWFAVWSLVCGFARHPIFMSVARGMQGAGAGFTIPSALALMTTKFPLGPERTFALAMFGAASCAGQTVGVLLGGIFDATIGWYWVFFFSAIVAAILAIVGFLVIIETSKDPENTDRRIDCWGVALFMAGIILIIYYLSESSTAGWASAKTLAPFLVGIVLLATFIFWESRIDYPIMPFHIWRSRRLVSSVVVIICLVATYNVMIFYTSLTFQNVLKYSPLITACCYIVHGVGLTIGLYTIVPGSTYWHYAFPALIVNCFGITPTWMSCQMNAVADASDEDQGVVGAIFNVAMQLGGPIGLALSTIMQQAHERPTDGLDGLMAGYRAAFYTFGVIGGVGFVLAAVLASNHDPIEFSGRAGEDILDDPEKDTHSANGSSSSVNEGKAEAREEKSGTRA
ncbi:hypothetical protein EC968_002030 [Mortierella alpina]|nr:hypothetical protein EC968_002030 [Mortierella alpina]